MHIALYFPILVGLFMFIFAQEIGLVLCRIGKSIWKLATFGRYLKTAEINFSIRWVTLRFLCLLL